jgi:hypothetical protein
MAGATARQGCSGGQRNHVRAKWPSPHSEDRQPPDPPPYLPGVRGRLTTYVSEKIKSHHSLFASENSFESGDVQVDLPSAPSKIWGSGRLFRALEPVPNHTFWAAAGAQASGRGLDTGLTTTRVSLTQYIAPHWICLDFHKPTSSPCAC